MKLSILLLFSIIFTSHSASTQSKVSSAKELDLRGSVRSLEIYVQSYKTRNNKKYGSKNLDTICSARYEFSKDGLITFNFDTISIVYKPNIAVHLDTTKYSILQDDRTNYQIATKKYVETPNEYEIRYRVLNEIGLLVTDSACYGEYIDIGFTTGSIVKKYIYDDNFNIIYIWFKSSFVFALRNHWVFNYSYDQLGNWTSMTRSIISDNSLQPMKREDLEKAEITPEFTVHRVITYY